MLRSMQGSPTDADSEANALWFVRTPTPQLRAFVAEQKAAMPLADFSEMMGEIRALFGKYTTALEASPRGSERARALHRMMDTAIATASGVTVSCHFGCCGCCHFEVEVTEDEGELLRERVASGASVDNERIRIPGIAGSG